MPVPQVDWAYKSVGLLPHTIDLGEALADYRRIEALIRYDAATGAVAMAADAARTGAPFENTAPRAAREAPAVIGILTALQEQHFKWSATISSTLIEDRRLALRALATGDALLAVTARAKNEAPLSPADLAVAHHVAAEIDKLGATLPDFLRAQLSFPYREGMQFVYWAFTAMGWEGVNALYAQPPLTSAEIIHPENYFGRRAEALRIFPAALIRRVGAEPIVEQSLGAFLIRTLLAGGHLSKQAADAAAAWRADRLFFFQSGGGLVTAWFSVWQNEAQAREFHRRYAPVLESRQRLRFQPAGENPDNVLTAYTRDDGASLLEVKGATVLFLNVSPADRLWELQEEAWRELEIEPEPKARSFDSARRSGHWSARSR